MNTASPHTALISLRDILASDLPTLYEHQADPIAVQMAAFPTRDREAFMAHWAKILGDGAVIKKAVLLDGCVIGHVGSFDRDSRRLVGYWIDRACWGRGVASAALAQFLPCEPARPLHAFVAKHNAASIRVLQKCGFRLVGEDKNTPGHDSTIVEDWIFELAR